MASLMEIMQLCRLCLVKDQVNIPIFEEQGDIRQIFLKISACLPVKVSREDNLPKKICDGCSYKLEILYQFWNTSANSEKQLLKWLSQIGVEKNSTEKVAVTPAQPHSSLNSDGVVLKQEIVDLADTHSVEELAPDDLDDSNDAQDYILQQQQLPYQPFQFQQDGFTDGEATASASTASATITSETVEAAPKRKRRAAAMKALPPHIDSEEEDEDDVDMVETKIAKTEEQSDDSGAEDPEPTAFVGLPSTSTDNEQPGPSGVGKGSTEAPCDVPFSLPKEEPQTCQENESTTLKKFICTICQASFVSKSKLKYHKHKHREPKLSCEVCGKKFVFPFDLKCHVRTHNQERNFKCDECESTFKYLCDLKQHKRTHTGMGFKFYCDECNQGFRNLLQSEIHYNGKHKGIKYPCDICEKVYTYKYNLISHKKSHAPNYVSHQYNCTKCDAVFQSKRGLTYHTQRNHGSNLQFICDICGKAVSSKIGLRNHLMIHYGEKPFVCDVCGKAFNKKSLLTIHTRVHTKVKPHSCSECNKSFTQRTSLVVHVRSVHTGEKPYECTICQKSFVTKTLMKTHSTKVHGISMADIQATA